MVDSRWWTYWIFIALFLDTSFLEAELYSWCFCTFGEEILFNNSTPVLMAVHYTRGGKSEQQTRHDYWWKLQRFAERKASPPPAQLCYHRRCSTLASCQSWVKVYTSASLCLWLWIFPDNLWVAEAAQSRGKILFLLHKGCRVGLYSPGVPFQSKPQKWLPVHLCSWMLCALARIQL